MRAARAVHFELVAGERMDTATRPMAGVVGLRVRAVRIVRGVVAFGCGVAGLRRQPSWRQCTGGECGENESRPPGRTKRAGHLDVLRTARVCSETRHHGTSL